MTSRISVRLFSLVLLIYATFQVVPAFALPPHARHVPPDSFLVFSFKPKNILEDSSIAKSQTWTPILNDWTNRFPRLLEFFLDPNSSGLKLNHPIHFFSSLQGTKNPDPILGLLIPVKDKNVVDSSLSEIAESLKVRKKPASFSRFGNEKLPFEFGRKGNLVYFIAVFKRNIKDDSLPNDVYLDEIISSLFENEDKNEFPASLDNHFANLKELSLYIDGTGLVRLAELFWPSNQWQNAAPLIGAISNRSIGIYAQSNPGNLRVDLKNLTPQKKDTEERSIQVTPLLDLIPGDSSLVAKLDFDPENIKELGKNWLDQSLKVFSGGKIDLSFKLPGINLSANEVIDSPTGNWVLGIGEFNTLVIPPNERIPEGEVQLNPTILSGLGISNKETLRRLSIGLKSTNPLGSLVLAHGMHVLEKDSHLWFTSPEFARELKYGKSICPLSKGRREFLNSHEIAADFNVLPLTRSIRRTQNLPYNYYKNLKWIEHISNIRMFSEQETLIFNLRLHDKKINALNLVIDYFGQELIDQRNALLYQAIAQNDFQALQQAVKMGALINANDHFGHSPLHYAAYKGNGGFVDFLLRNGGNPNTRSKHLSTPLHSAAWGRNLKVAEILLEDGADVNARSDEGETPAMTAALRGEKELLEILFSLSADPHAKDMYGSNLYDLASAGGHLQILDILDELKVQNNHPFHSAAGKGDLKMIKQFLNEGRRVDEKDAFGATPLIIATVSGKVDVVRFLLSKSADPKIIAKEGYSMMHAAAFSGKKELVQIAYGLGLDINARYGKDGVTPVDVGEDTSEAMPFLKSLGGRRGWELGRSLNH